MVAPHAISSHSISPQNISPQNISDVLPDALHGSVTTLGSIVPQADRCLPVHDALRPIFPHGGLVRGQVVGFGGHAGVSLAIAAAARAVSEGSWMAVVGFDDFGVEAADELGLPLERVVGVERGRSGLDWADRVAACADGFDVVMVNEMPSSGLLRRVRQRLHARGSVLIAADQRATSSGGRVGRGITDAASLQHQQNGCDAFLHTDDIRWVGMGSGHGALLARMVTVTTHGRRAVGRTAHRGTGYQLWLPAHDGTIRAAAPQVADTPGVSDATENAHRLVS